MTKPSVIRPGWQLPPGVSAGTTTRCGGSSFSPYDSFNLAQHVGDDPRRVDANRLRLQTIAALPAAPQWLNQTHSTRVAYLKAAGACSAKGAVNSAADSAADGSADGTADGIADGAAKGSVISAQIDADAAWTDHPGVPCAVLTADCLPILLVRQDGRRVAAIHAGWRGAAGGIIENTIAAACADQPEIPWQAWLGPCIGPAAFEVGEEVRTAFCENRPALSRYFAPAATGKWRLDLPGVAAAILNERGISQVTFSHLCTYSDPDCWYSYRRNSPTGRQASFVCILP